MAEYEIILHDNEKTGDLEISLSRLLWLSEESTRYLAALDEDIRLLCFNSKEPGGEG
jgi:hypothetical protein